MADRFNRTARTARGTSGLGIDLIGVPDIQSDINKKLSFLDSIQKMQQRAAAAQAASAAAAQGTFIGIDPATGEPVYMKGLPKSITKDERAAAMKVWSQRKAQAVIGQDAELNRIKSELYSGKPLSTKRQSDLLTQARLRTSALAKTYGINDTDAFQETFGAASKKAAEESATLDEASGGPFDLASTFLAGARQGFNSLVSGAMQLVSPADERAKLAKENTARNQEIAMANPVLRERTLREQEAAAEGKELGYFDATEGSTFANMVGTLGNIAGSFGPAIVATPLLAAAGAPAGVAAIAPSVAASVAVGQGAYNERVAGTEGLTPEQQEAAVSYDNPGALMNLGVNAAAGALFPGRVISGAKQMAGNAVARRLTARELEQRAAMPGGPNFVGPIHPSETLTGAIAGPPNPYAAEVVNGLNGLERYALQAGQKAGIRAAAPRSAGTLVRDVAGNSLENASIMGLATVGSNAAYNVGTGQDTPLTQGLSEGMVTGGLMGLPFGYMQYRGRRPASSVATASKTEAPSNTNSRTASTNVQDLFGSKKNTPQEEPAESGENIQQQAPKIISRARDKENWDTPINDYLYPTDESVVVERAKNLRAGLNFDHVESFNHDTAFKDKWFGPILAAARKGDDANVDRLMGEYLVSGGTIEDLEYMLFSHARGAVIKRIRNDATDNGKFPRINIERTDGWGAGNLGLRTFAGALANLRRIEQAGGLSDYLKNFHTNDGLSSLMGKLGRSREKSTAGKSSGTGGSMGSGSEEPSTGTPPSFNAPSVIVHSPTESGGTSGASQQGLRQNETAESNSKNNGDATQENTNPGRDANGAGERDEQPDTSTGVYNGEAGRGSSGEGDGTPVSEQQEPDGVVAPETPPAPAPETSPVPAPETPPAPAPAPAPAPETPPAPAPTPTPASTSETPSSPQPQAVRTTRAEQYRESRARFGRAIANKQPLKDAGFRAVLVPHSAPASNVRTLHVEIRDAITGRTMAYRELPKNAKFNIGTIEKSRKRWRLTRMDETDRNPGIEVSAEENKAIDAAARTLFIDILSNKAKVPPHGVGAGEEQFRVAWREPSQTKKVYKLMRVKRDANGNVLRDENGNPILYPLFIGNDEPIKIGTTYSADSPDFNFLRSLPNGYWLVDMTTGKYQSWKDYAAERKIGTRRASPNSNDVKSATLEGKRWMEIRDGSDRNKKQNTDRYGSNRLYFNLGLNGSGDVATYALRPGWHTTDVPTARQIKIRNDDHVWVEGSISADKDFTSVDRNGNLRDMIIMPREGDTEGFYKFFTSANAKQGNGDWYISSTFRPERIISDAEARSIVDRTNKQWNGSRRAEYDVPRKSGKEFTGFNNETSHRVTTSYADMVVTGRKQADSLGVSDIYSNLYRDVTKRALARLGKQKSVISDLNDSILSAVRYISRAFEKKFPFVCNFIRRIEYENKPAALYTGVYNKYFKLLTINYGSHKFEAPEILDTIQHEVTHGVHAMLSPTVRNALYDMYDRLGVSQGHIEETADNAIRETYTQDLRRNHDQRIDIGDELGANVLGNTDWVEASNNLSDTITNGAKMLITENPDSIAAIRDMTVAFAIDKTPLDLRDALIQSIIDTPEIRDMYLKTSLDDLRNGMSPFKDASAMAIKTAEDYVRLTEMEGVQRSEGSLREYLTEVFNPRTSVDVYSKASKIC